MAVSVFKSSEFPKNNPIVTEYKRGIHLINDY